MYSMSSELVQCGQESLLRGKFQKAQWALDAALYLSSAPDHKDPSLWQRGIACFYSGRYEDGVRQFECDMSDNGCDIEEIIWHFLCRCRIDGFRKVQADGFLPLRKELHASNSDHVTPSSIPPMPEVLRLYQGKGTVEDVFAAAVDSNGSPLKSYNGTNALAYAHFYIALYHEMCGEFHQANESHQKAAEIQNPDHMGKLMQMHYDLFCHCAPSNLALPELSKTPNVSSIIQGGWQLSDGHLIGAEGASKIDIVAGLLEAFDCGIRTFDCGDIYTGVEEIFGRFIGAHLERGGRKESIRIHTKLIPDLDVIRANNVDRSYVESIVRRSLNRLGVNSLSLVQLHWWDCSVRGYVEAASALKELVQEGLVEQIGLTNFDTRHTLEIVLAGIPIATTQVQYSLLDRRPLHSGLVSLCEQQDIKILAYGVLAGGFLTDTWLGAKQPTSETLSNRSLVKYLLMIEEFGGWELFQELLRTLHLIADRHGAIILPNVHPSVPVKSSIAMVAIGYVLRQKKVGGAIIGAHNKKYLQSTVASTALILTEMDLADIEAVLCKSKGLSGPVYGLERDVEGPHGRIMKYNLNRLNQGPHLEELCHRYLHLHFEGYPVEATRTGYRFPASKKLLPIFPNPPETLTSRDFDYTRYSLLSTKSCSYDHFSDIASARDIAMFCKKVESLLREAEGIDTAVLSAEQLVDYRIIASQLKLELVKWQEVKMHIKDPAFYLPLNGILYLLPTWGPELEIDSTSPMQNRSHPGVVGMSASERLLALLSRLQAIPNLLLNAHKNLVSPVEVFVNTALDICSSFASFLSDNLPQLCSSLASEDKCDVSLDGLLSEIEHASNIASECIKKYEIFLRDDILPRSSTAVGVGKMTYEKILQYSHFIDSSEQLLELGEKHFQEVKKNLEDLAAEIDPNQSWQDITKNVINPKHPTASNLLQSYLTEIERAREHMIVKNLVSNLPKDEKVFGFSTPKFLIPFSPVGDYLNPSPFAGMGRSIGAPKSISRVGHLMLHSIEARKLPKDEERKLLRGHDYTWISVVSPHESYPGHHVQALLAQEHSRILRKFHESILFYEGWGLYTEELAYETGFFAKEQEYLEEDSSEMNTIPADDFAKLTRLTQLRLRLWRAARIILDVKVNTGLLSFEDCRKFLHKEVMFNPGASKGEAFMYISRPCYAPCYVAGFVMLTKLREKQKRECEKNGKEFILREFHDSVLSKGCIPFELLETLL